MPRINVLGHWAPGVFRTQAFRIVLIYVFVFALSATVLVGFTYWNTERALDAQTDQIIDAEIQGLAEQYQRLGIRGLADVVVGRALHDGPGLYLLADDFGDLWPAISTIGPVPSRKTAISSNSITTGVRKVKP